MDNSPSKDAIQLLSEWARWVVTVEVAAIAAMGILLEPDASIIPKTAGIISVSAFAVSICLASFLLLNLPYFLDKNSTTDDEDKFLSHRKVKFKMYLLGERKQVGFFTKYISRLFTIGILFFAISLSLQAVFTPEASETQAPAAAQQTSDRG